MEPGQFFGGLMDDYFAECDEHLASLRRLLMELEQEELARPFAEERVRGIFRALHTLKGLSGMVGFAESEAVAHALEEWLRAVAPGGFVPPGASLDALFEGTALLERCLQARRAQAPPLAVDEFVARIRPAPAEPRQAPPAPGESGLSAAEALRLEAALARGDRVQELEFVPTPEGVARGVGVEAVRTRLGELGEILQVIPRVLPGRGVAFRFVVALAAGREVPEAWHDDGLSWAAPRAPQPREAAPPVPGTAASNVVRVGLPRLDELLRMVGELVISRSRLDDLLRGSWHGGGVPVEALEEINAEMERQLRDLREGVMRVRLVAVGEAFERMRFVVREVAVAEGKEVRVELRGQDTELDKLVVERMLEPLLHLVRNAVSHGIESPAERVAAGKPPQGRLLLAASAAGERVRVEVADDGRGIDRAAVAARAREQGLAAGTLDDEALLDLLCTPGFSTRAVADLASGRGVGMDVVRSTLRTLGGELSLSSEAGQGTRFTVELPLTLMIVDALLVGIGGQTMAVPQPALLEVIQVEADDVITLENNEVLRYRDRVLPLLRLRRIFALDGEAEARRSSFPVLVVGSEAQPTGLAVERLAGLREIVVRPLTDPLVAVPGIAAATELGDGRVCLILDAAELVQQGQRLREGAALAGGAAARPATAGSA